MLFLEFIVLLPAAAVRITPCCFLGCPMFCFDYQLPHKNRSLYARPRNEQGGDLWSKKRDFWWRRRYIPASAILRLININPTAAAAFRGVAIVVGWRGWRCYCKCREGIPRVHIQLPVVVFLLLIHGVDDRQEEEEYSPQRRWHRDRFVWVGGWFRMPI